jgi:hypothetical protein
MTGDRKIWILDDGELLEIRDLLRDAGIPFGEGHAPPDTRVQLLVTSARRALLDQGKGPESDTHLILLQESSPELCNVLEGSGCGLVMPLPLNIHAFTLLLNYALYEGPEKRFSRRVLLSAPVEIKRGLQWIDATLISLSLRGCGVVTDLELRIGREHELKLPTSLTAGDALTLNGRALSSRPAAGGGFESAMAFRLADAGDRRALIGILDQHGPGAELKPRVGSTGSAAAVVAEPEGLRGANPLGTANGDESERRGGERKHFTRRVVAAGSGISHVLIGRDLSSGGMRVRPDPDLEIGDVIKISVHGHPGQPAIMVKARVMRDDGDQGMVLRFDELRRSIQRRLEEMVANLPGLPPGKRSDIQAPANVIGEVLGRG